MKSQDTRIKNEIKSLKKVFNDIPDEKHAVADKLIQRAAFMAITLENLEDDIKKNGATYEFENGKQRMIIENPSQKSYNTMINRYTTLYDKLVGMLPKTDDEVIEKDDGFANFVGDRE